VAAGPWRRRTGGDAPVKPDRQAQEGVARGRARRSHASV